MSTKDKKSEVFSYF